MFAEPAVSTEVAAAAASPPGSAAFKVVALLAEGDGLPVDEELALSDGAAPDRAEVGVGPADAVPGDGDGAPDVGLADDELGLGDGELSGKQMIMKMHPWPGSGAAMARCAPVTPTRQAARTTGSVAIASSRLTKPPPTRRPPPVLSSPARPCRRRGSATRHIRAPRRRWPAACRGRSRRGWMPGRTRCQG